MWRPSWVEVGAPPVLCRWARRAGMLDLRHAGPSVPKILRLRRDLERAQGLGVEGERRDDDGPIQEKRKH